jgi:hypothetical protein
MSFEPSNRDIYELLLKLDSKINHFQSQINSFSNNNFEIVPNLSIEKWMNSTLFEKQFLDSLITEHNKDVDSFKDFILLNHKKETIPLTIKNKVLYVYCSENQTYKWEKFDDFHLKYIIVQVWQKFLDYYLNNEYYQKIEQNIRDLQQLKVIKMRYNLYEIQKNRKTILKFLFTLLS